MIIPISGHVTGRFGPFPVSCPVIVASQLHGVCRSANQHPESTIKKKSPQTFAHLVNFSKNFCNVWEPYNLVILAIEWKKTFECSRCEICVSCCVHLKSTYYARKESWAFYLNYPQINEVGKIDWSLTRCTRSWRHKTSTVAATGHRRRGLTPLAKGVGSLLFAFPWWFELKREQYTAET